MRGQKTGHVFTTQVILLAVQLSKLQNSKTPNVYPFNYPSFYPCPCIKVWVSHIDTCHMIQSSGKGEKGIQTALVVLFGAIGSTYS
jgi:hypothetical protein